MSWAKGFDVNLHLNSFAPAPILPNTPGRCLYFFIEGWNSHPDKFASFIQSMGGASLVKKQPELF
jgi:hypothetical protein